MSAESFWRTWAAVGRGEKIDASKPRVHDYTTRGWGHDYTWNEAERQASSKQTGHPMRTKRPTQMPHKVEPLSRFELEIYGLRIRSARKRGAAQQPESGPDWARSVGRL